MSVFDTNDDIAEWETMEDGVARDDTTTEPEAETEVGAPVEEDAPVEETAEPEEAAEPEPEAELDPAALQAQLEQLRSQLAEKENLIGRQSDEVGEVRRLLQQQAEQAARPQVSDWDSLIDENPIEAAERALQLRDQYRLDQAKEAMDALVPGTSRMWQRGLLQEGRLNELATQIERTTRPMQQQAATQQIAGVYQAIHTQYPDFDKFEGDMVQLIETRPLMKATFAKVVQEGSPEEQYAYLEDLHALASGRKADTLREASNEVARERATTNLRAKQEAQVASASASIDTDRPETAADAIGAEFEEFERSRSDGWKISS